MGPGRRGPPWLRCSQRNGGLSAYDAAYLELALRRLPLATLDDTLLAAMTKAGVSSAVLQA